MQSVLSPAHSRPRLEFLSYTFYRTSYAVAYSTGSCFVFGCVLFSGVSPPPFHSVDVLVY